MTIEYKSIQERNCEDTFRRFQEALKSGDAEQIGLAERSFNDTLDLIKTNAPELYKQFMDARAKLR